MDSFLFIYDTAEDDSSLFMCVTVDDDLSDLLEEILMPIAGVLTISGVGLATYKLRRMWSE